ncbi:MAG TPA: hypothetical protein VGS07_30540 [Thermoanaerobaculia bacterium]|jgi:hypothetical protein|nr:hypothetical protein [Thermoanaerobaculia bacterium]
MRSTMPSTWHTGSPSAYSWSIPHRVLLALSGKPVKEESKQRLADLVQTGARVRDATSTGLREALVRQVDAAGKDGLLVVSFAPHGFTDRNVQYLMAENSRLSILSRTAISAQEVFASAERAQAVRRLVLPDA